jgi:hypothetical protein
MYALVNMFNAIDRQGRWHPMPDVSTAQHHMFSILILRKPEFMEGEDYLQPALPSLPRSERTSMVKSMEGHNCHIGCSTSNHPSSTGITQSPPYHKPGASDVKAKRYKPFLGGARPDPNKTEAQPCRSCDAISNLSRA